jgi:dipeptidase D
LNTTLTRAALAIALAIALWSGLAHAQAASTPLPVPGDAALKAAKHAVTAYRTDVVETLAKLVSFNTVAVKDVPCERSPQHIAFKAYLKSEAERLGLDFADYGCVAVVGLGKGDERVGLVAHGDVQPVDPSKWKMSPFVLDRTSEPGRLLARGAEDDKGPIATALYAMKSLKDLQLPLSKRLELYVYMAEESDWDALEKFAKTHPLPQVNVTLDAEYPAVTAEKGFGMLAVRFPTTPRNRRPRRLPNRRSPASAAASSPPRFRKTPRRWSPTRRRRWKRRSASAARNRPVRATRSNGKARICW